MSLRILIPHLNTNTLQFYQVVLQYYISYLGSILSWYLSSMNKTNSCLLTATMLWHNNLITTQMRHE